MRPWCKPADDSPRRCQGFLSSVVDDQGERVRCGKYAIQGANYCYAHLHRYPHSRWRLNLAPKKAPKLDVRYSKYLSDTLKERLAELSEGRDALDLTAELQLSQATLADAAQMYDLVQLAFEQAAADQHPKLEDMLRQKLAAGGILRAVIDEVMQHAERVARVDSIRRDMVNVRAIGDLVDQLVVETHKELGDSPEALELVERLSERWRSVRLPDESSVIGTRLTPDMVDRAVTEMDATIPLIAHDEEAA